MGKKKAEPKVERTIERPVEGKPRRVRNIKPVRIEVSPEQHDLAVRAAKHAGLSVSSYFKMLLMADARKRRLLKDEEAE